MNGYIVSRSVVGLQEAIKKAMEMTHSAAAKVYLQEILQLPQEDQEKWFFSSEEVGRIGREEYRTKAEPVTIWTIIEVVCVVITTLITVWNEVEKRWENKQVETKICEEKQIEVPAPGPSPGAPGGGLHPDATYVR